LSDINSELESVNSGDLVDILTKNEVKLSINPLRKVKIENDGKIKENFITSEQISIINNPNVLFRIFNEEKKDKKSIKDVTIDEIADDLKCFNQEFKSKRSSTDTSMYSELS
jgi:hypothetical protein